jgi:hypothetical protein
VTVPEVPERATDETVGAPGRPGSDIDAVATSDDPTAVMALTDTVTFLPETRFDIVHDNDIAVARTHAPLLDVAE